MRAPLKKYSVLKLEFAVITDDEATQVFYEDKDVTDSLLALLGDDEFETVVGIATDPDAEYEAYKDFLQDKGG